MTTYKITLTYDGTLYGGWQVQSHCQTIQELVQSALATVLRVETYATGAGRTDAGVHAIGQCAHFQTREPIDCHRLKGSLNGLLPHDIRIIAIEEMHEGFHARYDARGKVYRYYLTLGPYANPFTRLYSWHISAPYDISRAESAVKYLLGSHDFASFANQRGSVPASTVRRIDRLDCVLTADGLYYEFAGPGFLYKMVRNLIGHLVMVAIGKLSPDSTPAILAACDRRAAASAAPAHGLFLMAVHY